MIFERARNSIYAPGFPEQDSYVLYRSCFMYPAGADGKVYLESCSDGSFAIFINGVRVEIYNVFALPGEGAVGKVEVTPYLKKGETNTIVAEVHHIGENFIPTHKVPPHFYAALFAGEKILETTGSHWQWTKHPQLISERKIKVNCQLGYTYCCDLTAPSFDDPALVWQPAAFQTLVEDWKFELRPVADLQEMALPETTIVQQGELLRRGECDRFAVAPQLNGKPATLAQVFYADFLAPRRAAVSVTHRSDADLSPAESDPSGVAGDFFELPDDRTEAATFERRKCRLYPQMDATRALKINRKRYPGSGNRGYYVIVDLNCESVGYLKFKITAPAGTVLDIAYGEHLNDGRVRATIGDRNFVDRYICCEGVNEYTYYHRRYGCRYLELHFTNAAEGDIILWYAGLVPLEQPVGTASRFDSPDRLLTRLNAVSRKTLHLCMHDHYEDCPWREQGLYGYDSRNQIMYGYYVWGNYDFAAASLDLLGRNFRGRYVDMISPGTLKVIIPVFSMVWITAVYEHYLFCGDLALAKKYLPQIDSMLDQALADRLPGGLCSPGDDPAYWNFCEWNGVLSRANDREQAPYNIYLYEALNAASQLHRTLGDEARSEYLKEEAGTLGKTLEEFFFSSSDGLYLAERSEAGQRHYEHIQFIMLANGLVPEKHLDEVMKNIYQRTLCPADLSALLYVCRALHQSGRKGREFLLNYLRQALEGFVLEGYTSLPETREAGDAFYSAGSLCHGWSSIMPYYCGSAFLGVTPLEPGFAKFEVKPYAGDLPEASGTVPTPGGPIMVSWKRYDEGLELEVAHPAGLEPVISSYPECPVLNCRFAEIK